MIVTHSCSWFQKSTIVELLSEIKTVFIILMRVVVPAETIGNCPFKMYHDFLNLGLVGIFNRMVM